MPNITQFKSRLNGGVRPNLYEVEINFPTGIGGSGGSDDQKVSLSSQGRYLCRSTSLPTHSQGLIEVPFRGRFLKIPGDRTFEAWTATFYNTSDFNLRAAFENWINIANQTDENIGVVGGLDALFTDVTVRQLSKDSAGGKNSVLRTYRLVDAWPTSVGAINVAFDSNDALEEFDVEFQYQYLDADKPRSVRSTTGEVPDEGTAITEPTYLSQRVV